MAPVRTRRTAARGGWLAAAVLLLVPLLLGAWPVPAHAAGDANVSLRLVQRWNAIGRTGTWSPYVATVRNDGDSTFTGEVAIFPDTSFQGPFSADSYAPYRSEVRVPPHREVTVSAFLQETSAGYHAEVRDDRGTLLARATPDAATRSTAAVALLTDVTGADQRVAATLKAMSRLDVALSRFANVAAVPADGAHLAGLNGLVIDQFGSASLGPTQLRAITDFVALGGTLIETGGAAWRRTLLPLPAELLPLLPEETASVSVAALADASSLPATGTADVATGRIAPWARATVTGDGGVPLVVEGSHGSGRVVVLTFDPLAAPFDTQLTLAAVAWSQALSRGLSGAQAGMQVGRPTLGTSGAVTGSGPGAWSIVPGSLDQAFSGGPTPFAPQLGVLVVLLIGYVLLISVVGYAALRRVGRVGLVWVLVPALAFGSTAGAYAFGSAQRDQDFQVVQVQLQRMGPGGVVETESFAGLISPRRGDVHVRAPSNTLVSTFLPLFGTSVDSGRDTTLTGVGPHVLFGSVPVWAMRPVQTMSVAHLSGAAAGSGLPVDVQLRLSKGRIVGQVVNRTSRPVRELQLVSGAGTVARLGATVAPGATLAVDTPLMRPSASAAMVKGAVPVTFPNQPGQGRPALLALAAAEAAARPGELALIGLTDPTAEVEVEGRRPSVSGEAVLLEPARLATADGVGDVVPSARLVSSLASPGGGAMDVYEAETPAGLTGRVGVMWTPGAAGPTVSSSAEVYDWTHHTWRPLSGSFGVTQPLTADEASGVVRFRVREDQPGQTVLSLDDVP